MNLTTLSKRRANNMKYQVTMECTRFEVVAVEANSEEEAEALALSGEYDFEVETVNEDYQINNIVEMP